MTNEIFPPHFKIQPKDHTIRTLALNLIELGLGDLTIYETG